MSGIAEKTCSNKSTLQLIIELFPLKEGCHRLSPPSSKSVEKIFQIGNEVTQRSVLCLEAYIVLLKVDSVLTIR